ncbi:acyl-CoA N-acyltransferase [Rhexocercosporidium sp. MPI-PUGE-AT-0058]|nr:acyl-CoA N-acyltransferase [Rhexocercosporidium sp. MPI-PUGE-AT-0058]
MAFEIIQIPHDDASIRLYVEQYKNFRLYSLKTAPECFGSTYAREIAFTDDVWYGRLANPEATTFVAMQSDRIVCTLTTIGPLPCTAEESPPSANPWETTRSDKDEPLPEYHLRIDGMFTLPEARGQGIAKALLQKSLEYGSEEARKTRMSFVASIVVDDDNPPAKALYSKCGFEAISQEPMFVGSPRILVLMKYTPKPAR